MKFDGEELSVKLTVVLRRSGNKRDENDNWVVRGKTTIKK